MKDRQGHPPSRMFGKITGTVENVLTYCLHIVNNEQVRANYLTFWNLILFKPGNV